LIGFVVIRNRLHRWVSGGLLRSVVVKTKENEIEQDTKMGKGAKVGIPNL